MTPIIDMHCDTIYKIYELRRQGEDVRLRSNNLHLDLGPRGSDCVGSAVTTDGYKNLCDELGPFRRS